MKLFFRKYQSPNPKARTVIILHGLFGSSDNWLTQAKVFQKQYTVFTVDQRNHGLSPHSSDFDYPSMVADIKEFIEDHTNDPPVVIGHSMGGKAAMSFATKYPNMLSALIIVDIAPRKYNLEHYTIVEGLNHIPIHNISSRNEADMLLSSFVPEVDVRQFLLKNLQRNPEGGFNWKINLPVITEKLNNIGIAVLLQNVFDKPTLFVRGSRSAYIREGDQSLINTIFPKAIIKNIDAGHWVQAEKPREFVQLVLDFLQPV